MAAFDPLTLAVIAVLVFLVAFTFANVGMGGGGLYVPILLLLYVDNEDLVVPISLSLAAATAISSAVNHWRKGLVDMRTGGYLLAGKFLGVLVGVQFTLTVLTTATFKAFFVALLFVLGALMVYRWRSGETLEVDDDTRMTRPRMATASVASAASGFVSGSSGVGGGVINVPILALLLGRKTRSAIGTSSLIIIPTAAFGFLVFAVQQGFPAEFGIIALLFPLTLVGAYVGSRWGLRALRARSVALLFIGVIFLAAILVMLDGLGVL